MQSAITELQDATYQHLRTGGERRTPPSVLLLHLHNAPSLLFYFSLLPLFSHSPQCFYPRIIFLTHTSNIEMSLSLSLTHAQ